MSEQHITYKVKVGNDEMTDTPIEILEIIQKQFLPLNDQITISEGNIIIFKRVVQLHDKHGAIDYLLDLEKNELFIDNELEKFIITLKCDITQLYSRNQSSAVIIEMVDLLQYMVLLHYYAGYLGLEKAKKMIAVFLELLTIRKQIKNYHATISMHDEDDRLHPRIIELFQKKLQMIVKMESSNNLIPPAMKKIFFQ